jgi:hypothetical protein
MSLLQAASPNLKTTLNASQVYVCTRRHTYPAAASLRSRFSRPRLDALGPRSRAELLQVLMLPDFGRAERIGEFWSYPESRSFAELLIDCE